MSIKGFEMLREHMSYYDFNPDSVLLLGNVLYYLKQAEGEVAELESENAKLRELVQEAVDAASLKDMRDWSYGKRLVFLREARELGIEVDG